MQTEIKKWGNSAVVRLPATLLKRLKLAVGDPITITSDEDTIIITPTESNKYQLSNLLADVTPENIHSVTDWGKPVGNEGIV